ncbi:MAG: DAK2 domain-containing protein [Clostridiales bacterium]|nr:DAK2 domain-containing protein [Clostridiales bacterium]
MKTMRVDGNVLRAMFENGLENIRCHEEEVNMLNVFPVPDGDTGTNMRLTLEGGLKSAKPAAEANLFLQSLSKGMLYSARGNSGVILSQFFNGLYLELSRCPTVSAAELRNACIRGYRSAYKAVVKPTEGTILTVTRLGIENIRAQIGRRTPVEDMLSMYLAEMKKTLTITPELLDVLKEEGVVDSGAIGYIYIVEGMLKYLYGEKVENKQKSKSAALPEGMSAESSPMIDMEHFNENSVFVDGYCMEFILQMMKGKDYLKNFRLNKFINDMSDFGNSIVAIQDDMRVKVHIHTKKPAKVIETAQAYGEFITFKLENMQVMHNHRNTLKLKEENRKPMAVVAVVNGEGVKSTFRTLGCDAVIDAGPSMNVPAQDFVNEYAGLNADTIVVLPDNKNTILAAVQAEKLYAGEIGEEKMPKIVVLESANIAEGYFAKAMENPSETDVEKRIAQMKSGIEGVSCLAMTRATKAFSNEHVSLSEGDGFVTLDDEVILACPESDFENEWANTLIRGIVEIPDIADKEICVIFRGEGTTDDDEYLLTDKIAEQFPLMDVAVFNGGQSLYSWIIGIA